MSPPDYSTLGQTPGSIHMLLAMPVLKIKDVMDPVTHALNLLSHSSISQKMLVSFSRGTHINYRLSNRDG